MVQRKHAERQAAAEVREQLGLPDPKEQARLLLADRRIQQMDQVLDAVLAGCYLETAFAVAGISKSTGHRWLRRGAKGEEPYASFTLRIRKALGEAQLEHVRNIQLAGQRGDWRASSWWLERTQPHLFGQRMEVTQRRVGIMENQADAGSSMDISKLTLAQKRQLRAIKAQASGQAPPGPEPVEVELEPAPGTPPASPVAPPAPPAPSPTMADHVARKPALLAVQSPGKVTPEKVATPGGLLGLLDRLERPEK